METKGPSPHCLSTCTRTAGQEESIPPGENRWTSPESHGLSKALPLFNNLNNYGKGKRECEMKFIFKASPALPSPPPGFVLLAPRVSRGPGRVVSKEKEICEVNQNERGGIGDSSGAVGSTGAAHE